jgi:hypothetical protein
MSRTADECWVDSILDSEGEEDLTAHSDQQQSVNLCPWSSPINTFMNDVPPIWSHEIGIPLSQNNSMNQLIPELGFECKTPPHDDNLWFTIGEASQISERELDLEMKILEGHVQANEVPLQLKVPIDCGCKIPQRSRRFCVAIPHSICGGCPPYVVSRNDADGLLPTTSSANVLVQNEFLEFTKGFTLTYDVGLDETSIFFYPEPKTVDTNRNYTIFIVTDKMRVEIPCVVVQQKADIVHMGVRLVYDPESQEPLTYQMDKLKTFLHSSKRPRQLSQQKMLFTVSEAQGRRTARCDVIEAISRQEERETLKAIGQKRKSTPKNGAGRRKQKVNL